MVHDIYIFLTVMILLVNSEFLFCYIYLLFACEKYGLTHNPTRLQPV